MPKVISVLVTPRVCAAAAVALTTSAAANIVNLNFMVASSLTVTEKVARRRVGFSFFVLRMSWSGKTGVHDRVKPEGKLSGACA
jgi:hypothetical protein